MTVDTDEALMARYVRDNDREAFAALFHRYVGSLTAMLSRTGASDVEALDLVQQTFLQLHNARHDYQPDRPLRPWLYAIALNVGRGAARKQRRRREDPIDEAELGAHGVAPQAATAEDRAVRRAVEQLPDDQREVIVLHWFQGLDFNEVARIVDASVGAVRVRAHRGYNRLREMLGGGP